MALVSDVPNDSPLGRTIAPGAVAGEAPSARTPITAAPTAPVLMPAIPRWRRDRASAVALGSSSCGSHPASIPWTTSGHLSWDAAAEPAYCMVASRVLTQP